MQGCSLTFQFVSREQLLRVSLADFVLKRHFKILFVHTFFTYKQPVYKRLALGTQFTKQLSVLDHLH